MAEIKPFRAVRYDESKAGPLASLVAPPYDVIGPEERLDYLERSPYNVVHLTLPESEEEAGRDFAAWREEDVLVDDEEALLGARAGLRRPRRRRPNAPRADRRAEGRAVRDGRRPPARANAPRAEGGAAKAPPRGARAARADLPPPRGLGAVRAARPAARPRGGGKPSLADRGRRHLGLVRRPHAPDRRRSPSLRDRPRLRGGGRVAVDDGGARLRRGSRAGDLPHAQARAAPERRRAAARPAGIPATCSQFLEDEPRSRAVAVAYRPEGAGSSTARRASSTSSSSRATPPR